MRKRTGILLLLAAAAFAEGKLGGAITGGKAKQLLDKGLPLLKEADEIYKTSYVLEEGTEDERETALARAVELYDKGTALLQEALELQEDAGVNWRLTLAARNLARSRAWLLRRETARRLRERPPPPPPPEEDEERAPEPRPAPPPPPRPAPVVEETRPRATLRAGEPPAVPVDAELPAAAFEVESAKARRAIADRVTDYYQSLRPNTLRHRHRLCRGTGKLGGAACEECRGTGEGINLHHFRKVYWTSFTPLLRSAEGAPEALEAFHARAAREPAVLGPVVKACKVKEVDVQGVWARVSVELSTDDGRQERRLTLVSIGSTWFFYCPETDRELIGGEEAE